MADIFISYRRADQEIVRFLVESLEAEGWSVFPDRFDLSSEDFKREVTDARCVVVVWTLQAKGSADEPRLRSASFAGRERGTLVTVVIGGNKPPDPFGTDYFIHLLPSGGKLNAAAMSRLLGEVRSKVVRTSQSLQQSSDAAPRSQPSASNEPAKAHFGKIFLNYRRADAEAWADRLFERLVKQLPRENVFMDIDGNIPIGLPWATWLDQKVAECDLMLVLIGRSWMDEFKSRSQPGERDFVRVEIESALARGIPVVPVFLGEAPVPRGADLPEGVRPLLDLQAVRLTRPNFDQDAAALVTATARSIELTRRKAQPAENKDLPWFLRNSTVPPSAAAKTNEPSMEEILASLRRIIAESDPPQSSSASKDSKKPGQ